LTATAGKTLLADIPKKVSNVLKTISSRSPAVLRKNVSASPTP